ncbi:AsmA family protein [Pedobacter cryotolerans]|uniref:AsmA family protein n=1 Tax=Pedobacter cryotolerans TaxID=2571270 RepID=A0A4U1BVW7_9SPHI|nr:AsmA-like C-terminal region-containing protein [Pedobacter cryotolerans]TKB96545.1 AsmA family protein [Pedobacter cryotolerans]
MQRWLKISLKILAGLFTLIIVVWLGAAYYINHNNKSILNTILTQLNANVNGKIEVGSMETTLLKGFPGVSVSLKKVQLRDSLWAQHKHDLLNAKDIDVSLNIFSLIAGNIKINKIGINNAGVYLYTDSNGYSNTSMFKSKTPGKPVSEKDQQAFEIKKIAFNNVNLVVDNQKRLKLFNFLVEELNGNIDYPDSGWNGNIKLKTLVKNFAFNTKKGSFLKDKQLEGTLVAHYNNETKAVTIEPKKLSIGGDEFIIGAKIDLAKDQSAFAISVRADKILYKNIALLLSPNISSKLLKFAIDEPIAVVGNIIDDGSKNSSDPLIDVRMTVKKNTITIPSGQLTDCSFTGAFKNREVANKPIGDENSAIRFYNLTGNYYNAPLKIDTFSITNLARPLAAGLVTAQFPLTNLNQSIGGETFNFKKGTANMRLYCKADIDNFMFTKPIISGTVDIKDADITYIPRNMKLVNSSLTLNFNQKDLNITGSRFQLGNSILNMSLSIENFLNFYYTDPSKILVNLKLSSPQLSLNEFIPFLATRKAVKRKPVSKNSIKEVSDQLSAVLEAAKVNIQLNVNRAIYKRFVATNLNANIAMLTDGIYFNKLSVKHAGGSLSMTGNLKQTGAINKFTMNAIVSRVNVKEFFYGFENFGQTSITNKNLKGFLSAKVNTSGSITDNGTIVKRSMYGKVNFNLSKAALVNFEPLQMVQKLAFANRDFTNIAIDNLDGTLILNGDKITISPMQVNTSVLNFNMKGIYGLERGTDIAMDIPLRNPEKDKELSNREERRQARMKGIVLHLKAIDDGKGGLKVRWNKDHD